MSEAPDNVEPVMDNSAPESGSQTESKGIEKFGDLLQYAPDDIKDAGTWDKFRDSDIPTALKTIRDMDSYIGKKGDIPQEGASQQLQEFAKKLGAVAPAEDASYVNFSPENFGEGASELNDTYNGGIRDAMSMITEEFSKNPTMEGVAQGLAKWAENDAKATMESQLETKQLIEKQLSDVAGRYGLSPDQLKESNKETLAKYGWDLNELTAFELLHVLGKETSGSNTLRDSLVSTPAGKQARLQEIYSDPDFMDKSSPNYQKLVQEHYKLMDDLMKG